jgi:hypothetical protein
LGSSVVRIAGSVLAHSGIDAVVAGRGIGVYDALGGPQTVVT